MPTILGMDTKQIAQRITETLTGLQTKKLTPDEARSQMAAIKAEVGEAVYECARIAAVLHIARG